MTQELARCLVAVLDQIPGQPHRPQLLARRLGISQPLASRILAACRALDPFASAHQMPGVEGLGTFAKASRPHLTADGALHELQSSIDAYDHLLRHDLGDRATFDSVVAQRVPRAREQFELSARHEVFRGWSKVKGLDCEIMIVAKLLRRMPEDPSRYEIALVHGNVGLRRLRPGVEIRMMSCNESQGNALYPHDLNGVPVHEGSVLLDQFCSSPTPQLVIKKHESVTHYFVREWKIGLSSAATIFFAHQTRGWQCDPTGTGFYRSTHGAVIDTPSRLLVMDNFLHRSMASDEPPSLAIHDQSINGPTSSDNAERDSDRIHMRAGIEDLGTGLQGVEIEEQPGYGEIIGYVAQQIGWDIDEFRGYRCRLRYPLYGSQVGMLFPTS